MNSKMRWSCESNSEIISVFDSEGNEYFEVDYLAQDMVYKELKNKNYKNDNVPSILKPMLVSRKFIVETTPTGFVLQFGSGEEGASNVCAWQRIASNKQSESGSMQSFAWLE